MVLEPSAKTTERVYVSPAVAAVAATPVQVGAVVLRATDALEPGVIVVVVNVSAQEPPPKLSVPVEAVVLEVPEFTK